MPTVLDNHTGNATLASGSFVTLVSIPIQSAGDYVIVANCSFDANTNGIRILLVDLVETTSNNASNSVLASGRADLQFVQPYGGITTGQTIYIRVYQTSGATLSVAWRYRLIKIR